MQPYRENPGTIACPTPLPLAVEAEGSLALRARAFPFRGDSSNPLCGCLLASQRFAPWMSKGEPLPEAVFKDGQQQDDDEQEFSGQEKILCRQCLQLITTAAERIEIQGSHQHTFSNPAGLLFQIGCFRLVPGCVLVSPPEAEWSWFSGYCWQVVLCSSCATHMGWRYTGGSDSFYGLILHRLLQKN